MSAITEVALFKACVDSPRSGASVLNMNLAKIRDPQSFKDEQDYTKKKALKLYHLAWSGITKYMRTICQLRGKPIEFPNLGVFFPVNQTDKSLAASSPLKLTSHALGSFREMEEQETKFCIYEHFLDQACCRADLDDLMEVFDSNTLEEARYSGPVQPVNYGSIAKVCDTDAETIEIIIREIVCQLRHMLKHGANVRLMLKIGRLVSRGGMISWRSFRDDDHRLGGLLQSADSSSIVASTFSNIMINSTRKKDLSVITPQSITSRTASQTPKSLKLHMSNPNPSASFRYKAARELSYGKGQNGGVVDPEYDMLKFGQRVGNKERRQTSQQVLEAHLRHIGKSGEVASRTQTLKSQQNNEFIQRIRELEDKDRERRKGAGSLIAGPIENKALRLSDVSRINQKILEVNSSRREQKQRASEETNGLFPFVNGDQVEQHKAMISSQMRNDLQNYLAAKDRERERENAGGGDGVAISPDSRDFTKSRSVKSTLCAVSRQRVIKHIFDSDYVKPDENFRVYQESHPKRSAVLKDALDRYEAQLQSDTECHNDNMNNHRMRVEFDHNEFQRERELKRTQQNQFKDHMLQQMALNAEKRKHQSDYDRRLIASGLTTENHQGEAEYLHYRKLGQQSLLMNKLTNQILKRQQYVDSENEKTRTFENNMISDCLRSIDQTHMQNKNDRHRAKKHWDEELERTQNWNNIKAQLDL